MDNEFFLQFYGKSLVMSIRRGISTGAALFVILFATSSWGYLVHRTISQLAVYKLPPPMQSFFYSQMDSLVAASVQPDLRRSWDSREAPRHFIDLENYGDSAAWKMPLRWEGAIKRFGKDSLKKFGYLPYAILATRERLIHAFREKNRDSIIVYAGDLCHYIGDAHVPLHTTANYDGQLSGQKGLHALWESTVPDLKLETYNLNSGHQAVYLADPAKSVWEAIRRSHSLLRVVLAQEKEAAKDLADSDKYVIVTRNGKTYKNYSRPFAAKYASLLGNTVNDQMLRAADLTADFWYTCWQDAGRPDLSQLLPPTWSRKDRKSLKSESSAYKANALIERNLLLSRKMSGAGD